MTVTRAKVGASLTCWSTINSCCYSLCESREQMNCMPTVFTEHLDALRQFWLSWATFVFHCLMVNCMGRGDPLCTKDPAHLNVMEHV